MADNGFVYKWTNHLNNKWYVGSHRGTTDDGYVASGRLIQNAIKKYGIDNFSREILYEGEDFRSVEEETLRKLDARNDKQSYNLVNTAHVPPPMYGYDNPMKDPEIAKRCSDAKKGKPNGHLGMKRSEETKDKMRNAQKALGYKHTEETKQKMTGRTLTQEHCKNISKAKKGKPWTEARRLAQLKKQGRKNDETV